MLEGATRVGHDHRSSARHGLRETKPKGLVRTRVHDRVRRAVDGGKTLAGLFEGTYAKERQSRCCALEHRALGAVAEEPERERFFGVRALRHLEEDVPALLDRKATDRDEEWLAAPFEELVAEGLVAGDSRVKHLPIDTERHQDDALAPVVEELGLLRAARDEGSVYRLRDAVHPGPERLDRAIGKRAGYTLLERRAQVRVDEVRVPHEGAYAREVSRHAHPEEAREVGRVELEHVRTLGLDGPAERAGSREQVVGWVVRRRRSGEADDGPRAGVFRLGWKDDALGARPRCDDNGIVAELARDLILRVQMASNSSPALRVEFGQVNELHPATHTAKAFVDRKQEALFRRGIDAQGKLLEAVTEVPAFAELAARAGRPLKIAIVSDFTRIPYANGAVFQTRFLYRALRRCGHQVTLVGPRDPNAQPGDVPEGTVELPSLPLAAYPGVHLPIPSEGWVFDAERFDFDLVFAQTTSTLLEFALWLRKVNGTPVICVNTTHLTMAYEVLLPEALAVVPAVHKAVLGALAKPYEATYARLFNDSDGLIVLSEGFRTYWRERGVTAPIHVVPRTVTPENFDRPVGDDPFVDLLAERGLEDGPRLLCAGRHTREKAQDRLIRIFAKHVLPVEPKAILAMVGIGPDTERYKDIARELGVADRVIFTGERPFTAMLDFYAYADVFVHTSLSETYGNVLGEALWCGCPTVAFEDGIGASSQVSHEENGLIVDPGKGVDGQIAGDIRFGAAVLRFIRDPELRSSLGRAASKRARARHTPAAIERRMADVFQAALDAGKARAERGFAKPRGLDKALATAKSFVPWTASMVGLYASGFLRPANRKDWGSKQPTIG